MESPIRHIISGRQRAQQARWICSISLSVRRARGLQKLSGRQASRPIGPGPDPLQSFSSRKQQVFNPSPLHRRLAQSVRILLLNFYLQRVWQCLEQGVEVHRWEFVGEFGLEDDY